MSAQEKVLVALCIVALTEAFRLIVHELLPVLVNVFGWVSKAPFLPVPASANSVSDNRYETR